MNTKTLIVSLLILGFAGPWIQATAGNSRWPAPNVELAPELGSIRAYPNPWRSDRHSGVQITFDRLSANATVRIFTVSAQHVKTLETSNGTSITWDLTNDSGSPVASGIYLYLVTNNAGEKTSGKLAVIK